MALFERFGTKNASRQESAPQTKPKNVETAKQAGTREHYAEIANRKPIEKLPEDVKTQSRDAMAEVRELMHKATQHRGQTASDPSSHSGTKDALMHNQSVPGKEQKALSPTDSSKGHTHSPNSPSHGGGGGSPSRGGPSRSR